MTRTGFALQTQFLHYNIKIFILSFALYYILYKIHYHRRWMKNST